jgi:hypothetical protein
MSERAAQLSRTADRQVTDLIEILSTRDEATLRRPCPGREKLGDGTVAACAQHITDNYHRIAGIARHADLRDSARHGDDTRYSAQRVRLAALLAQLSEARVAVGGLAGIADDQLIPCRPPARCDSRTGDEAWSSSWPPCSGIKAGNSMP